MLIQQSLIEVSIHNHASVEIFNQENCTNLGRVGETSSTGSNSAFPHIVGCIWFGVAPEPTHSLKLGSNDGICQLTKLQALVLQSRDR